MNSLPEIVLTPKTLHHITDKGASDLSLELKPLYSCCVPYTPPPHISLAPPKQPGNFLTIQQNGINIHIDQALIDVERITIDKYGFGIFSWLSVVDWRPLPP